jgi:hypothetical protein
LREALLAQGLKRNSYPDWPTPPSANAFEAANDNCPISNIRPGKLIVEAMLAWLATFVLAGIALAKGIEIVAHLFSEPGFAELKHMGFTMAAVLGIGIAVALVIGSLRKANR